jgi:diguanylate cyclase
MRRFVRSPIGISLLVSLALWMLGSADFPGHPYWNIASKIWNHPASRSVVVVDVDDIGNFGNAEAAHVLDRVRRYMPRKVYFDQEIRTGLNPAADAALARATSSFGRDLTLVVRSQKLDDFRPQAFKIPPRSMIGDSAIVLSAWTANAVYYVESAPYSITLGNQVYPTLGADLAGIKSATLPRYYPDFFLDPDTILQVSGRQLLDGEVAPALLAGRAVVITSFKSAPTGGYFGHGITPLVMQDIAGAEGLKNTYSIYFSFIPLLACVVLSLEFISRPRRRIVKITAYSALVAFVIVVPVLFRIRGILVGPDVSIVMLTCYGAIRFWQTRIRRIRHTSASGLPNLIALAASGFELGRDVVVVVVARYEEMLATLPPDLHGECALQIARRFSIGSKVSDIYQGDGGHFGWTEEARPLEQQVNHLEGLRALFAAPLQVGSHTFDTNIHFGLDRNEGIDQLTRVNSAVASANEALSNNRAIELFEAKRLAEAPWELSLHARIEEGLHNGDIWLAFQSQWDFAQDRVSGAEALIRWNHPTRGPIAPDAFILQAERAGRIDTLTYWVLEQAITAALEFNSIGPRFQMSINLSAQMVDKPDLVANFAEITRRRGIDPALLTIEITETSSVSNRPAAVYNLSQLRALGFRLSIDDFGTGEASLTYLADLPSDELKLDRRFVSRLLTSDRDRAIIISTIALAHALGQSVVAEGIEDEATCVALRALGCDCAQGYFLGRPQPFATFLNAYVAGLSRQNGDILDLLTKRVNAKP